MKEFTQTSTLKLTSPQMQFSSAHFTIFSEVERENLHGHNFRLACDITSRISKNGMAFDYNVYKNKLIDICKDLDGRLLLPSLSEYLKIEETQEGYACYFSEETLFFLKRDVKLLPVDNVTIEALSIWILSLLSKDLAELKKNQVESIFITVSNSPSQSATTVWKSDV